MNHLNNKYNQMNKKFDTDKKVGKSPKNKVEERDIEVSKLRTLYEKVSRDLENE